MSSSARAGLAAVLGPLHMPPGFEDEGRGPDFMARTKYGVPLPPGDYLAVLDIVGLTHRLEHPVTVEDPPAIWTSQEGPR